MIFPLRKRPVLSYRQRPRAFGSPRDGGARQHAGCDLYANPGDEVLAVADGIVSRSLYKFYDQVYALEVNHPAVGIVRYGEVSGAAPGIKAGASVHAGEVIAYVGKMHSVPQAMLHFEMYAGTATGLLTDVHRPTFMRRADLIDPSDLLDSAVPLVGPAD
jgi:murein DD-endopeptidase MepM/ murein hydrolase activator NlpD